MSLIPQSTLATTTPTSSIESSTESPTASSSFISSTASSNASPIPTEPLAGFTTPFPQPTSCSPSFTTTTVLVHTEFETYSLTLLLPDQSIPYYSDCLDPVPARQFTLSPAVCPEGWAAWWMAYTYTGPVETATTRVTTRISTENYMLSTAYCCAPGFSIHNDPGILPATWQNCSRVVTEVLSSTRGGYTYAFTTTSTISEERLPAWHVSWKTTDLPSMTPLPPDLSGGGRVVRWVPGSDPEWQPVDNWGGGHFNGGLFLFGVIGVPVLITAVVGVLIWWCCWSARRNSVPTTRVILVPIGSKPEGGRADGPGAGAERVTETSV